MSPPRRRRWAVLHLPVAAAAVRRAPGRDVTWRAWRRPFGRLLVDRRLVQTLQRLANKLGCSIDTDVPWTRMAAFRNECGL